MYSLVQKLDQRGLLWKVKYKWTNKNLHVEVAEIGTEEGVEDLVDYFTYVQVKVSYYLYCL